ncbi:MAG TPA: hypothetical protein VIK86_03225 [Candidatus Paceibacterota bacterium]
MKVKSWIKYLIYMCLILIVIFWGQHVFEVYKQNAEKNFSISPYYQNFLMIVFYGSVGLLLGLEHLICEIRKKGAWVVNLPKIVLMGIPSLYFSLAIIIYYNNLPFLSFPLRGLIVSGANFINAFQVILGYSIITSFYKANKTI